MGALVYLSAAFCWESGKGGGRRAGVGGGEGAMEMKLVEDCSGKGSNEVEVGGNKKSNEGVGWGRGAVAESEVPPLI